jgi:ParB family chromosome partitioning protein
MGRGLSALLAPPSTNGGARETELREIPVDLIAPNPRQPRTEFDESSLLALADSVRERDPAHVRGFVRGTLDALRRGNRQGRP